MVELNGERGDQRNGSGSGPGRTTGTQAVDRAAELLTLVLEAPVPRSFTALVRQTGLAKSTASRLLQALERHGLLYRDENGEFRPGPQFSLYALRHEPAAGLVEVSRRTLRHLGEQTGETVNLAVPRGGAVLQVDQVDSAFLLAPNWVGIEVPAHCSALGKVLYAFGALPIPSGPLEARTPHSVTTPAALERELVRVRRDGYATSAEELESGLVSVAAPVRARGGAAVAAISVSGPSARLYERTGRLGRLLVGEADRLSRRLGHHSATTRPPPRPRLTEPPPEPASVDHVDMIN